MLDSGGMPLQPEVLVLPVLVCFFLFHHHSLFFCVLGRKRFSIEINSIFVVAHPTKLSKVV
jgi:hypothetical protein